MLYTLRGTVSDMLKRASNMSRMYRLTLRDELVEISSANWTRRFQNARSVRPMFKGKKILNQKNVEKNC